MPSIVINTNVPSADLPKDFLKQTHVLFQKLIRKPDMYVAVHINPGQMMSFGGTDKPCALVYVMSIHNLDASDTPKISAAVAKHLEAIGISPDRHYVSFYDAPGKMLGWNGGMPFAGM